MGRPLNICGYTVVARISTALARLDRQEAMFNAALRNADRMELADYLRVVGENYLISRDIHKELEAVLEVARDNRLIGETSDLEQILERSLAAVRRLKSAD
jgi:hypothetical protein